MNRTLKILLASLVVAAVFGGYVFFKSGLKSEGRKVPVHVVKKGDMLVSVTEGGTLDSVKETSIRCKTNGQVIFLVDEGTFVKKGEILVELDDLAVKGKLDNQKIAVESARASYIQAKENLEIRKSLNASQLKEAELKVTFAKMDLEKYVKSEWPLLVKKQEAKITIAKDELARAEDRNNWTKELHKKGYATRSELEADSLNVKRKRLEVEQEQEQLKMMKDYENPQKVAKLKSDVEKSVQELDRVKRRGRAEQSLAQSDLNAKKANLKNHEDQLEELGRQLSYTKILAPQDGLVVYYKERHGPDVIALGSNVHVRQHVIDLPDTSSLKVRIRVHESRVSQLAVGQLAYITLDAVPDKRFRGKISRIAPMPDPRSWWTPNLKVYSTDILVEDELPKDVKPGLSAKAEVIVDKLEDVLTVPIQCVTVIKKQQVCYVQRGVDFEPVKVEVGNYNDTMASITSGLKEGDIVRLDPPTGEQAGDLGHSVVNPSEVNRKDVKKGAPTAPRTAGRGRRAPTGKRPSKAMMPKPSGRPRSADAKGGRKRD